MTSLLIIKGYNTGIKYNLKETTTIGRAEDNNICIPETSVSRYHAEIIKQNLSYIIKDKDSANGIFINGEKISEHLLLKNDEIKIGSTVFLFDSDIILQNAVYNNKSLIMTSSDDDTLRIKTLLKDEYISEIEKSSLQLLSDISELFTPNISEPISEILNNIVNQTAKIFRAESAGLMLYDKALNELKTVSIIGEEQTFIISSKIINESFQENKSILYSSQTDKLSQTLLKNYEMDLNKLKNSCFSTMVSPLALENSCIGIIFIQKNKEDFYSLKDLRFLQSLSRLITIAIWDAKQNDYLKNKLSEYDLGTTIIGTSKLIKESLAVVDKIAPHSTPILITGETGTGKELFAKIIHQRSKRKDEPFVAINCSAIPQDLFESEFFGHEKGSFTGAYKLNVGKVEIAHGGTLFLDEIGDLPLSIQPKLLRFLEEMNFYRIGGTKPVNVNVRIIAATNKDLEQEVIMNKFRKDLLYRLSVIKIILPPLRDRKEDIKPLAEFFLKKFSKDLKKNILGFSDEAIIKLESNEWQGNIRELSNCIERAVLLCSQKIIQPKDLYITSLNPKINIIKEQNLSENQIQKNNQSYFISLKDFLEKSNMPDENFSIREFEKELITFALEKCERNQKKAANFLKIHRNTLANKIKEYGIKVV